MVSFDVTSLFTNVPAEEALLATSLKLQADITLQQRTDHSVSTIMNLITLCINNMYFEYNGVFYKQRNGLAMGCPLSPALSEFYLDVFETQAIEIFDVKPVIYKRYVDDTFIIWPQDIIPVESFLDHMNCQAKTIKFTIEYEKDGKLPFLDVEVKREGDKISTSVYRKVTDSGRYLHYDSNHPQCTKTGIASTLLHRAKSHCHKKQDQNQEEVFIEKTLVNNGYPNNFVKKLINKKTRVIEEKEKPEATVCIPYVRGLSEKIQRIGRNVNLRTVFSSKNTLKSNLVRTKPEVKRKLNKNVVYSIPCACAQEYIGETSRPLEVRVKEHRQKTEKRDVGYSKLVDHAVENKHQIQWDEAKVIGRESHYKKRKILEAIEMARRNFDTISQPSFELPPIWTPLLQPYHPLAPCDPSDKNTLRPENIEQAVQPPARRSARLRSETRK